MHAVRWARVLAPLLAVAGIVVIDLIMRGRYWPLLVHGIYDEVGHLLTAALVLAALLPPGARLWPWALVGAVVIDLDHLPLFWPTLATVSDGRPITHSLFTVGALLALAAVLPRARSTGLDRIRTAALGLALGVLLHFMRDVVTSNGLPLAWPLTEAHVRAPYSLYVVVLLVLAAAAVVRRSGELARPRPAVERPVRPPVRRSFRFRQQLPDEL